MLEQFSLAEEVVEALHRIGKLRSVLVHAVRSGVGIIRNRLYLFGLDRVPLLANV